jgi:hypothetical protein
VTAQPPPDLLAAAAKQYVAWQVKLLGHGLPAHEVAHTKPASACVETHAPDAHSNPPAQGVPSGLLPAVASPPSPELVAPPLVAPPSPCDAPAPASDMDPLTGLASEPVVDESAQAGSAYPPAAAASFAALMRSDPHASKRL